MQLQSECREMTIFFFFLVSLLQRKRGKNIGVTKKIFVRAEEGGGGVRKLKFDVESDPLKQKEVINLSWGKKSVVLLVSFIFHTETEKEILSLSPLRPHFFFFCMNRKFSK